MLMALLLACGPEDPEPGTPVPATVPTLEDTAAPVPTADTAPPEDTDTDVPPPPCVEDAFEDNDDHDNALPVPSGPVAVLDTDPDHWVFDLQPGESRRVELTFDHTWGNIDLGVYNELHILVGTSYSFSDDEAVEVTNTSTVPTVGRIRVQLRDPGCNAYEVAVVPIGSGEGE